MWRSINTISFNALNRPFDTFTDAITVLNKFNSIKSLMKSFEQKLFNSIPFKSRGRN